MSTELEKRYQVDILAEQAGGYFSAPSEQDLAYTDLLFSEIGRASCRERVLSHV